VTSPAIPLTGSAWLRLDAAAGATVSLSEHEALHGPLPMASAAEIMAEVEEAGLTGRGGAAFPVHRKLAAVAAGAGPRVVVANGAEGEPASNKDKTLLAINPHLTLDGLQLAARAVGATAAYMYVHTDLRLLSLLNHAIAERRRTGRDVVSVEVVCAPPRFVSGEESAVVSRINGGPAKPRPKPPRVFESGVRGRPTLVSNVETLAHLALIAGRGAAAFRSVGHADQPGTMLFTVSGAVHRPGVIEAATGTTVGALLDAAGGPSHHLGAVLLGGFHGGWLAWPAARELPLANPELRPHGLAVGAGVVVALPADVCGVAESVRVLDYLAAESAGQCGPCVFGLPRLAETFGELARGKSARRGGRRLSELSLALERRGGCSHPDGSLRFLRSAAAVFADELRLHAQKRCSAVSGRPILPTPAVRG
jgi:NADH:ubiquinone oxidoreductase subunit F (NADH-binding)